MILLEKPCHVMQAKQMVVLATKASESNRRLFNQSG